MQTGDENEAIKDPGLMPGPQSVLFAQTPHTGMTIGVVSPAGPSSLALLAAGVAGMAARRVRRERVRQIIQSGQS